MKNIIIFSILTYLPLNTSSTSFAAESLHAHEHGSVKVGIAVEKNTATINIDTPTESLIGFEYKPQTTEEKAAYNKAEKLWKTMFDLVAFDPKLGCQVAESSYEQKFDAPEDNKDKAAHTKETKKKEGIHSDIEATAKITCKANIEGTSVQVAFKKQFKHIQKLTVDVVSGKTFSVDVQKPVETIKL